MRAAWGFREGGLVLVGFFLFGFCFRSRCLFYIVFGVFYFGFFLES